MPTESYVNLARCQIGQVFGVLTNVMVDIIPITGKIVKRKCKNILKFVLQKAQVWTILAKGGTI